ncbi:MAG TPA: hypothetical protein VHF89_19350 [Solirubrobacteraceae bacterium]|nr:hypothetical protein [Solirubrobacteraceae bacterium]
MLRPLAAVLAAAALVAASAGCGGSGDEEAMTVGDYRAAAAEICRDAKQATAPLIQRSPATDREYRDMLEELVELNEEPRERLADLEPPEELRAAHRDLLAAHDLAVELTGKIVERLEAGETRQAIFRRGPTGRQLVEVGRRRDEAARRLGVRDCASAA